jgi:hypothetical protein
MNEAIFYPYDDGSADLFCVVTQRVVASGKKDAVKAAARLLFGQAWRPLSSLELSTFDPRGWADYLQKHSRSV